MESWKTTWRYVAGVLGCAVIGYFPFVQQRRVPLLGGVDLGFHELGHMLTYALSDVIAALMGSVFQVAVPLGLAAYFGLRRRDLMGAGLCLAWAGASAADVSVYIADAPFQRLPLIGGSHDWAYLLGPAALGNMNGAAGIAEVVKLVGAVFILAGIALCFLGPFRPITPVPFRSPIGRAERVREPRRWEEPETLMFGLPPEPPGR
ncbi:MAG: hypothetical protein OEM81_02240 [Acidimicrobiia bacterium]|nr:hypothetical protein [Acidimicrobiia bacterium]MDH3396632.1 hypothetical protein [Acidimicrobiia bacterium]